MKDVIKLKQTESGYIEDENGVEYIKYGLVTSMQKSVIDENNKLRARMKKLAEKLKAYKTLLSNKESTFVFKN